MKKLMRVAALAMSSILAFTFVGCGANEDGDTVTLRVSYNANEEYPHYEGLAWAAEEIENRTEGRVKMEIYPNGTLGDQKSSMEMVQAGAIDLAVVNASIIESYNSDFSILSMPYFFNSVEHQRQIYTSDILDDLFETVKDYGFEIVSAFGSGSRNIFASKPVRSPEDLSRMKIRVMQSDTMVQMLKLMGGVGVPMSASEQYSAISQGVVDGAETNEIDYIGKKYYEVAPYFSRTAHCFSTDFVITSPDSVAKLSEEDQAIFYEVMDECVDIEFDSWVRMTDEMIASAEGLDVTFIDDVDVDAFKENFIEFQESIASKSDITKAIYEEVNAIGESLKAQQ